METVTPEVLQAAAFPQINSEGKGKNRPSAKPKTKPAIRSPKKKPAAKRKTIPPPAGKPTALKTSN